MRIAIDIRSLQDPYRSGVGVYTEELLKKLLPLRAPARLAMRSVAGGERSNLKWILFANAFKNPPRFDEILRFAQDNTEVVRRHFPNRPLNLWMQAFGKPTLDRLASSQPLVPSSPIDCFFMPNLKFGTVSKNVPLVVTVHDLAFEFASEFYSHRGQWSHRLLNPRRLLARADWIIAVSHATKNNLVNLYNLSAEKITVIYPGPGRGGIDFEPIASKVIPPGGRDILFLATVEPRKNVPGLIRAFGLIAEKYPETRLVIAGFPGWGEREVERECGTLNAECRNRIVRIPNVSDKTRAELFARAAVFAYPSFYEGFGFPVLEAMAAGVPVVAGALGALPEVVGDAGLLADPDDPQSIATALDAVLNDASLASRLRARGWERVKQFSWDRCAAQTLETLSRR